MKILVTCLDQEILWAIDDEIGGLYSIDLKTFETQCVIDCQKLFPYGKFEVLSLFKWKENCIVIVPLKINKSWIIYNKVTKEIEYRKIIERKCREILISVDQDRNQLYFFPLDICDPILIIDMNRLTCLKMIENWSGRLPDKCKITAWKGAYSGQYIFFPIKNTEILVRMNCETQKVDLLKLNIPEKVIHTDYAFGELWVLPMHGNKLYQIDENGLIVNIVELSLENILDTLPDFARIIVQKRYLFLLPCYQKGIYVYDKLEQKMNIIAEENLCEDKAVYLRYWEYYIRNNQICFLPFGDKCVEIDLNNLRYEKKELFYPNTWSDKEKIWRSSWSKFSEQNSIIGEAEGYDMEILLKYLQYKKKKDFSEYGYIGNEVWKKLKN